MAPRTKVLFGKLLICCSPGHVCGAPLSSRGVAEVVEGCLGVVLLTVMTLVLLKMALKR